MSRIDLSPRSATRQIVRSFLATLALGIVMVALVRSSIELSLPPLTAPIPSDAAPLGSEVAAASARVRAAAIRQTADAAGRNVVLWGLLAVVSAATATSVRTARRARDIGALAARIDRIEGDHSGGTGRQPVSGIATTDALLRRIAETQHSVRQRIATLDAERRRGFHVLGHLTDGVVAVGADRRVLLLNPAARYLLGLTGTDLLGRRLADIVRAAPILAATDAVLGGKGPQEGGFQLPGSVERFVHVQAVELPADGPPGVLVTIHDETKLRQLEKMRREFIANVSHELKTPLSAIKGYAETLQLGAKEDVETCTHFLHQIHFQTERLERLINDMLQLARAQTGAEHLRTAAVPLAPVLEESVAAYEPLARARGVELRLNPAPQPAAVVADREALLTIANNLIGNAVRYTPSGGHVEVSCRPDQDRWALVVADDGIGIPQADQQRIFERFYRVEKARDANLGGTGLGLSIVKNLVQALGGEVRLESRPGKGSTFEVLLRSASPDPR